MVRRGLWLVLILCAVPAAAQHAIPDLCATAVNPLVIAAGTTAVIPAGTDVSCIAIHGQATIPAGAHVTAGTIQVHHDGALRVENGTFAQPTTILVGGVPFDATDPEQFGNGLVIQGHFAAAGAQGAVMGARLAGHAYAGDRTLVLSADVPWPVGAHLLIADTRQLTLADKFQDPGVVQARAVVQHETVTIAARPDSRTVLLAAPLAFDHLGIAADGLYAHAALLDAGILIDSARPEIVKGHVLCVGAAVCAVHGVRFGSTLGRTTGDLLNSTTNIVGRYGGFHCHFNTGGCLVTDSIFTSAQSKWGGVVVHHTDDAVVRNNVCAYVIGCLVTEDGTESNALFEHNFAFPAEIAQPEQPWMTTYDPLGAKPSCGWFRSPNIILRGNVCAGAHEGFGFQVGCGESGPCGPAVEVTFRDPVDPTQTITAPLYTRGVIAVEDNEIYSSSAIGLGLWWYPSVATGPAFARTTIWHAAYDPRSGAGSGAVLLRYADIALTKTRILNERGEGVAIGQFNDGGQGNGAFSRTSVFTRGVIRGVDLPYLKEGQLAQAPGWRITDSTIQAAQGWSISNYGQNNNYTVPSTIVFAGVTFDGPIAATAYSTNTYPWLAIQTTVNGARLFFKAQDPDAPALACPGLTNAACAVPNLGELATCRTEVAGVVGYLCGDVVAPPPPPAEVCGDGIDNDGDGVIDEGCPALPPPPPPADVRDCRLRVDFDARTIEWLACAGGQ